MKLCSIGFQTPERAIKIYNWITTSDLLTRFDTVFTVDDRADYESKPPPRLSMAIFQSSGQINGLCAMGKEKADDFYDLVKTAPKDTGITFTLLVGAVQHDVPKFVGNHPGADPAVELFFRNLHGRRTRARVSLPPGMMEDATVSFVHLVVNQAEGTCKAVAKVVGSDANQHKTTFVEDAVIDAATSL